MCRLPLSVILTISCSPKISQASITLACLYIWRWRDPIESWCHQGLLPKLNSVPDQRSAFRLLTPLSVRLLCAMVKQRVALYWSWWGQKRNRRSWTQTQSSNLVSPAQFTRSPVTVRHTAYATIVCLSKCVCECVCVYAHKSVREIENMWK